MRKYDRGHRRSTTDIAVISLAGTVVSNSVKISSETFDQDIIRYVRKTYNVFIGEQTAEAVKSGLVPLIRGPRRKRWRSREETSSPDFRRRLRFPPTKSEVPLSRRQTRLRTRSVPCWKNAAGTGIRCFRPRHYPDRRRSLLAGMDELIQERTGINTVTAENPASVVALGTGQYREVMNEFESQF